MPFARPASAPARRPGSAPARRPKSAAAKKKKRRRPRSGKKVRPSSAPATTSPLRRGFSEPEIASPTTRMGLVRPKSAVFTLDSRFRESAIPSVDALYGCGSGFGRQRTSSAWTSPAASFGNATRKDVARATQCRGNEMNGPGTYGFDAMLGHQINSERRSSPNATFAAAGRKFDLAGVVVSPGPVYNVQYRKRNVPRVHFGTSRRSGGASSAGPGPSYKPMTYIGGKFGGPSFSFGTSKR